MSKWSKVSPSDKQHSLAGRQLANVSGFDVSLLTLDGENAETIGHGGVADRLGPVPPSERLKKEFLFLKPGEEETWRGSIEGTSVKPGKYQTVGAYIPDYDQVHDLVGLPEAQDKVSDKFENALGRGESVDVCSGSSAYRFGPSLACSKTTRQIARSR